MLGCRGSEGIHHSNDTTIGLVTNTITPTTTLTLPSSESASGSSNFVSPTTTIILSSTIIPPSENVSNSSFNFISPTTTISTTISNIMTPPTSESASGSSSGFEIPPLAIYIGAGVSGLIIWIILGLCLLFICKKQGFPGCCSGKGCETLNCLCLVCDATGCSCDKSCKCGGCDECIDGCLTGCGDYCKDCWKDCWKATCSCSCNNCDITDCCNCKNCGCNGCDCGNCHL